jgi:hypothetical protein
MPVLQRICVRSTTALSVALFAAALLLPATSRAAFDSLAVDGTGSVNAEATGMPFFNMPATVFAGPFSDGFTGVNQSVSVGNSFVSAQADNSFSNTGQVLSAQVLGGTTGSTNFVLTGGYNSSISGSFSVGLTGEYKFQLDAEKEPTSTENADSTNTATVTLVSPGSTITLFPTSDGSAQLLTLQAGTQVSFSASISGFIGGNPPEGASGLSLPQDLFLL